MAKNRTSIVSIRCPVCYSREIDVLLLKHNDKREAPLYCVKCSFTGSESMVRDLYANARKKYQNISRRITLEDIEQL